MVREYYRVGEVARLLGVSPSAVRRYVNSGKLQCHYTPTGQRVFYQEHVDAFLGVEALGEQVRVYYVRVSDGDDARVAAQRGVLAGEYGEPGVNDYIIVDKASGLNERRSGLRRLMKLSQDGKVNEVLITHKDRLTRFGFSYLEEYFKQNNVRIRIVNEDKKYSLEEELLQDFMSLIASFSGKFYRLRGYEQQQKLLDKARKEIHDKTPH